MLLCYLNLNQFVYSNISEKIETNGAGCLLHYPNQNIPMRVSIFRPSETAVSTFIEEENAKNFTYTAVGATARGKREAGYNNDYQRVQIGKGQADFEKAKQALRAWVQFPAWWTAISPRNADLRQGNTVAMFFMMLGLWWRNSCRIVYVVEEVRRFGFAYGTLPAHIESGEELFLVEWDEENRVWYEIRAFSRPRYWLAILGYPLARILQEKFRQDSAAAMLAYVRGMAPVSLSPNRWILHLSAFAAAAVWLWPGSLMQHDYGLIPLAFALLVMTPWVFLTAQAHWPVLWGPARRTANVLLPAGVLGVLAMGLEAGRTAALLATPWLLACMAIAWLGLVPNRSGTNPMPAAGKAGFAYLFIGGAWFWADRAGIQPLAFDDAIVRLTALHFHYAGFALPVLAGFLAPYFNQHRLLRYGAWLTIAGIPMTAIGITATQYHLGPLWETLAAVVMSIAGMMIAGQLWMRSRRQHSLASGLAAIILFFTMSLSLTYGIRSYWPYGALDLDQMRAIHGSLNGLVALPLAIFSSKPRFGGI